MADVRLLIQEEGRAARNLIAFNVPVGTNNTEKVTKKPPSVPRVVQSGSLKRTMKPATRVRSASTGRDKKSELQARYWAFLFGNLQRAIDGIYQTCEEDENISECKEVILVLENYMRDFHNLIEWFKVKWAYENSPPPLRRTPLAWEIRKTSPCRIWNSNIIPKPASPLQRMSPTESCKSPIDQNHSDDKCNSADNKIVHIKEEPAHRLIKDKTTMSKQNSALKEKRKNVIERGINNSSNKEKSKTINRSSLKYSLAVKRNGSGIENKMPNENVVRDVRNKTDCKSTLKPLQIARSASITKTMDTEKLESISNNSEVEEELSNRNKINKSSTVKSTLNLHLSSESHRCEINEKVKKENEGDTENKNRQNGSNVAKENIKDISEKTRQKIKRDSSIVIIDNLNNKAATKCTLHSSNLGSTSNKTRIVSNTTRRAYSTISQVKSSKAQTSTPEVPRFVRSKTTLCDRSTSDRGKMRPGTSVIVRRRIEPLDKKSSEENPLRKCSNRDINGSVEVLTKQSTNVKPKDEGDDGWQTVRSRYRRGSTHSLNMSMRFHKPSTATSLPALSIESPSERNKRNCSTSDENQEQKRSPVSERTEEINKEHVMQSESVEITKENSSPSTESLNENATSTSVIAAIFKNDAELLEKRIKQFMAAQAERERIILEEERKTEEADSQRSQQLSDEEASLKRQIMELENTDIDVDTETDETDGEMILEMEDEPITESLSTIPDDISLEDRYENMLEGMSWAERVDTLAQLQALVARHPGRALELHQKLSSPSRKRSLPETLRRYQAKQACAQHKRQKLLMEKSQRLRELLNKVEDVKSAKSQLIEDKRVRMEMKLKRAEENRTQHLLEIVRKAHDEDSKLKEIAFINELEAQNKRHDFMALCQEQEERLQGIQEERQRRQEEKAAKEAAAEERRKALEAERQLRIQKMRQARREREERVGKMQLEREKERQELAREKARDREERLSALHAAQLANQEELQKKIAQKQQESARRHVENIEHIRQRAVESSILRSEEVPPTLKSYPSPKQCCLCGTTILNEVCLLSHLKGKTHLEAVRNSHDGREPSRDEIQKFNIAQIRDVPAPVLNNNLANDRKAVKEKQKAMKRRCRKIKQRMASRGQEWENNQKNEASVSSTLESTNKTKFRRNLKELDRLYNNNSKTAWSSIAVAALERCLGEISRAFSKSCPFDQDTFRSLNGFDTLINLLNLGLNAQNGTYILPNKSVASLCRVYKSSVCGNNQNVEVALLSNKILVIVDLLLQRLETLTGLDDQAQTQEASNNSTGNGVVAASATQLLCGLIPEEAPERSPLQSRIQELTSYLVTGGLIERVARHARALIETDFFLEQEHESCLLLSSYELLARLCRHSRRAPSDQQQQESSSAQEESNNNMEQTSLESHLLGGLLSTECAGAIGALYSAIALTQQNQKGSSPTPNQTTLSTSVRALALRGFGLLVSIAELDLEKLQNLLGAEGTSLQWRLIASHVITRLSRDPLSDKSDVPAQSTSSTRILTELFTVLGYFAINNPENQTILQSGGAGPSVLQQLCTLPFPFYGDPRLTSYTLPTLLAATHRNPEATAVLSCELSYQLLEEYKNSQAGKSNPLVRLLKET